jgi:hypothetical protein
MCVCLRAHRFRLPGRTLAPAPSSGLRGGGNRFRPGASKTSHEPLTPAPVLPPPGTAFSRRYPSPARDASASGASCVLTAKTKGCRPVASPAEPRRASSSPMVLARSFPRSFASAHSSSLSASASAFRARSRPRHPSVWSPARCGILSMVDKIFSIISEPPRSLERVAHLKR